MIKLVTHDLPLLNPCCDPFSCLLSIKKFTKMIKGCNGKKYEERLDKLGVMSLEDRQLRADLIQVYKILNDNQNIYQLIFLVRNDRISRGNSLKLFKKRGN